jgi:peptide/nickel transport system ATP-binding protein
MTHELHDKPPLIEVCDLGRRFSQPITFTRQIQKLLGQAGPDKSVKAVDQVSLQIRQGEVLGLVGESGCGKSTLGRLIAGLVPPTQGDVVYRGSNIVSLRGDARKKWRARVQLVFQDPFASLNPRMRIGDALVQAPVFHGLVSAKDRRSLALKMLDTVGLPSAAVDRYPHQFSGGQRQRIGIARALAMQPEFLVCDEPVAALDVSVQAQVLNLFLDLREKLNLTYLFISHDLGVIEHLCDRVAVMYLGRIVEVGDAVATFDSPRHPYTRALLDEVPRVGAPKPSTPPIRGEIPSPMDPPTGCHFHPRCPFAVDRCRTEQPQLRKITATQWAACHLSEVALPLPQPAAAIRSASAAQATL